MSIEDVRTVIKALRIAGREGDCWLVPTTAESGTSKQIQRTDQKNVFDWQIS